MRFKILFTSVATLACCVGAGVGVVRAQTTRFLKPGDINASLIRSVLRSEGFNSKIDSDGDVQVDSQILDWWVVMRTDREVLFCQAFYNDSAKKVSLAAVNNFNANNLFKVFRSDDNVLTLSHIIPLKGGISEENLLTNLRLCASNVKSFWKEVIPE